MKPSDIVVHRELFFSLDVLTFRYDSDIFYEKNGAHLMENTIEIKHLSKEDKLRMMEAIWEDLLHDGDDIESPKWHKEALDETEKRLNLGEEKIVDRSTAKKDFRKKSNENQAG